MRPMLLTRTSTTSVDSMRGTSATRIPLVFRRGPRIPQALLIMIGFLVLTGCAMGPNYKRPAINTPAQYRQPVPVSTDSKASLADTAWANLFQDQVITNLVQTALRQSNDLEAATQRVLQARAQLGITRSQLAPQITASGGYTASRTSSIGSFNFIPPGTNLAVSYTQAGLNLAWEVDVWGRLRRLTESARAQYLAQEEARHAVRASLIADVITGYLTLRELDLELEIARKTRDIAENGLKLTNLRKARGAATGLDVRQAEQLLYTATAQIAATERAITETENLLNVLLGQNPGDIPRGKPLVELLTPEKIPAGLPSDLLERRPDIRQAEQTLIAANAQIGAARALFFPQISLTGLLGVQSRSLGELFTGPGRNAFISPAGVLPIFNAGQLRNNLRLTEAQQREMLATYRKTIQTAFQEVSSALSDYQKNREQRSQEELLVKALEDTDRLSTLRYKGGLDSYLQVLDAQRNEFAGELTLAQLRKNELLSVVQLYRALGGGWQNP
jgi:NodT family efflux transporter outer membrane factor (OMF) lipoprotein